MPEYQCYRCVLPDTELGKCNFRQRRRPEHTLHLLRKGNRNVVNLGRSPFNGVGLKNLLIHYKPFGKCRSRPLLVLSENARARAIAWY